MKPAPSIPIIRQRLLTWFSKNSRDLPWRRTHDPYLIAVSEVMLQQTQVDRVKPKFLAWRRAWPTTKALTRANLHDVLKLWSGLGYNSRGKRLRDAARAVMEKFSGRWPRQVEVLETLPGFGPYTARAVASFAYNADVAVIDTNVRRVLSRIFFGLRSPRPPQLNAIADQILPPGQSATWHGALMDFGSAVCTSRAPKCNSCPVQKYCRAYPKILTAVVAKKKPSVKFQSTDRYWRGSILRTFLTQPSQTRRQLRRALNNNGPVDNFRVVRLIADLIHDGLLIKQGRRITVAS